MSETVPKEIISKLEQRDVICDKCNISFKQRKSFYHHLRNFHPDVNVPVEGNQLCGMCGVKFLTMSQLHGHLQVQHDVNLNFVKETFYCEKDFFEWKTKIEYESQSSFCIRNSTHDEATGQKSSYYMCHRSGVPKYKVNRVRHVKSSGSVKCGCTCPAVINMSMQTIDEICEIKVRYQSNHVGHDLDSRKLRLSREERTRLASSLNIGVPLATILEQTKEPYAPTRRLLTRKDLYNVGRDFKINIVCQKPVERSRKVSKSNENDLAIDIDPSLHKRENSERAAMVFSLHGCSTDNLAKEKYKAVNEIKKLLSKVQSLNSSDLLHYVGTVVHSMNAYVNAITSISCTNSPTKLPEVTEVLPITKTRKRRKIASEKKSKTNKV